MVQRLSTYWFTNVVRSPGFWIIVALFILISVPHYDETLHPPFVHRLFDTLDMDRHAFERILYLLPIVWAGFLFGHRGAYAASLAALACMLPRAILISPSTGDALFEAGAVFIVGNLVGFVFTSLHKERRRRRQLDSLNGAADRRQPQYDHEAGRFGWRAVPSLHGKGNLRGARG